MFKNTGYLYFIEKCATSGAVPLQKYVNRTPESFKPHSDMLSADVQKFCVALCKAHECSPTDVVERNSLSLAVAVYLGELKMMHYAIKDLDTRNWVLLKTWKVLRSYPRWLHDFDNEKACEIIAGRSHKEGNWKGVSV